MTSRNAGDEIGEILSNLVWDTYERDNLDYRPDFDKAKAAIEHYTAHQVQKALEKPNSLLRSAYQIAKREMAEGCNKTNWGAFYDQIGAELKREHEIMYLDQQAITDSGTVASKRGDV
jgi:hypothetical protein